jgi:hypothetical protein
MQGELAGLLNDAGSLSRFVRYLSDFCHERRASHRYIRSSEEFFGYIDHLAGETQAFLQGVVDQPETSALGLRSQRLKLATVKRLWTLLHGLIKPVADAHTLRVPSPLLGLLERQLRTVRDFSDCRVVTLLSPDLNYFQYRTGLLSHLATELQSFLPNARPFPGGLAFVAIPYSQGHCLFTNVLLYHEVGHFVFATLESARRLLPDVNQALASVVLPAPFESLEEPAKKWLRGHLLAWSEETYCDLFALSLIGPAYSLASMELFNLLALLDKPDSLCWFSKEHPAEAYRFAEQLRYLQATGWWEASGEPRTEHHARIEALASKPEGSYTYPEVFAPLGDPLIQAFLRLRQRVRELVEETCGGLSPRVEAFTKYGPTIQKYLLYATVPSTLTIGGESHHPDPVAIVNASLLFSLASLTALRQRKRGYQPGNVADHGYVAGRVELWAMKAIEDCALLNRLGEAG